MTKKKTFLTLEQAREIAKTYPTPFHIYDERGIRENAARVTEAFSWNKGFREYFAVKATPNPFLLKILQEYGCGVDCSSETELMMSDACGFSGEQIMFSSNDTPAGEFALAAKLGGIINLDDITHIASVEEELGQLPETMSCRYNPGGMFELSNGIMDNPGDSKYGMTPAQITEAFRILKAKGVKRFGLHAFLASNTPTPPERLMNAISAPVSSFKRTASRKVYEEILTPAGLGDVAIYAEMGRFMLAPYGALVTKAIHEKHIYKEYIGVDACAVNLMRPAMYGAYHHITVLGKEDAPLDHVYDVTGSLCENNDKFAIGRELPEIEMGDYLYIHDTGAHGFSMGYNYNGKLRSAELLLREDGSVQLIRRAETPKDYFATFDFCDIMDKYLK